MGKKKQLSGKNQAATTEQSFEESHFEHQEDSFSSDDTQPKENLKVEAREEQQQVEQHQQAAEKESTTNSLLTQTTTMMISDETEEHQQLSTPTTTTTTDYDDTYHHQQQQQQQQEEEEQVVHTEQNNMETPSSYDMSHNIDVNDLIAQFPTTTDTHYHNDDDKFDHFRDEPLHHHHYDDEPFQQQPSYESSSTFSTTTTTALPPPPLPSHLKINKQQSAVFPPIPSNLLSLQQQKQQQQQQQQVLPLYSIQKISNNTGLIIRFYQINAALQLNRYHPYARIVMQNESTGGGGLFQQPSSSASTSASADDDESDESTCSLLQSICATRMNQEVLIAFVHPNTEQMRFETVVIPSSKQVGGVSLFVRSFVLVCAESHVQILKMNDNRNNEDEECQTDFSMSGLKNQFHRVSVTGGVNVGGNDASVVLAVPGSLYTKILCSSPPPMAATSPSAQDAQGNMDAWIVRSDRLLAFESTVIVSSVSDSGSSTDRLVNPASESCPLVRLSGKGRVYLSI